MYSQKIVFEHTIVGVHLLPLLCKIFLSYGTYIISVNLSWKKRRVHSKVINMWTKIQEVECTIEGIYFDRNWCFWWLYLRHIGLEDTQKQDRFKIWNISWSSYGKSCMKSSNNVRPMYLKILLYSVEIIEFDR